MNTVVSFEVTKAEGKIIKAIALRAVTMALSSNIEYDFMSVSMDVTACHANGCKLRLADLLAADDFNFSHDIFGIRRHINRDTGVIEFFSPRYHA